MKVTVISIVIDAFRNNLKYFIKDLGELEIRERVEINQTKHYQNIEKSPGDLRRFALSQTSVKKKSAPGDHGSIPGRALPKTQKVLDAALLNTQHYKVRTKGKIKKSCE